MSLASAIGTRSSSAASMLKASGKRMRQTPRAVAQLAANHRTVVVDRVVAFLRGRHPTKIPENTEAETGIAAGTVQKWLDRGSAPNALAIFHLIAAYGPEFICAVMTKPPAWLDRARREEASAKIKEQIAALQAKLERVEQ